MPLLAGHRRPPAPIPPVPVQPPIGCPVPTWYPPDGSGPIDLDPPRGDWMTLSSWANVTGAAPVALTADPDPRGGSRVRHVHPEPKTVVLPLRFRARTHMGLVVPWREMVRAFTQTRRKGPGVLRITRPDGSAREIEAYYEAGFDGEPGQGVIEDTAVLSLYCPDPFWRDVTVQRERFAYSEAADYYDPYASISSGQVLGEATVVNDGDVEAWPELAITGPAALITATNHTTGESYEIDPTWDGGPPLVAGDTVTVATFRPDVTGPQGENWTGSLNWPHAQLWGLEPGRNEVDFAVAGAGEGSSVTLTWRTRHETP